MQLKFLEDKVQRNFALLVAFLVVVFLTGGSARQDVSQLMLLRPLSILVAAYALASCRIEDLRRYSHLLILAGLIVVLHIAHLVPLPPAIWQNLGGRSLISAIESATGLTDVWRPLAMVPSGAVNSFYSLATPIAVLLLMIQLPENYVHKTVQVVLGLAVLSALVGVIQASGVDFHLYRIASETPPGLFANRNHQGALMAMIVPLAAVVLLTRNARARGGAKADLLPKVALAVVVFVSIPLVLVTGSRMGLFLSGIALLGVGWLQLPQLRSRNVLLISIALVVLMAVVTVLVARGSAISRLDTIGEDLRYPVWETVWQMIPDYLPLGSGVGSYVEVYQIHEPLSTVGRAYSNHAHNDWLEVVLTAGLPGLALLLYVVAMVLLRTWRVRSAKGVNPVFNRLGVLIIIMLAIASISDYPLRTPMMMAVVVIAGVWAALPNSRKKYEPEESHVQ